MKGFGMISVNNVGWIEAPKPVAGPMDAILKPLAVAPCSSDTHVSHGGAGPLENRILGHESVGEVVEVGSAVKNFKPGDKVIVNCVTPDWEQPLLQDGFDNNAHDLFPTSSFKFVCQKDGVFAEYYHVNNADGNLFLMPEDISIEDALMTTDMMSTGFHAVENAEIKYGDNVVVFGIGPVGLMAVAGAALAGAGKIYAIGTRPNCAALAREYGANEIISYKEGDVVEQILDLNHGQVDKVLIAGGNGQSFVDALKLTRANGIISNVNFLDPTDTISFPAPLWGLGMANVTFKSGFCPGGARRIERLVRLIQADRVHPGKLLNKKFEGFDKIEDAFKLMDEKPKDLIKPYVLI
ncbi:MAG: zinc-binding dehydrogenase [Lachnospiraceae bacterium]|nr:zinc-binding dehydrogenase [Lachnospiraceae bacterium]MBR6156561.1 zinc-binding dehydrogenase [Lachnospiraceae bacterium]MBR6851978.1 zinc-binding dehydrogenase [Lachnospiraceae bacterium]